ncbi:hypothetical protein U1Q18_005043 [Sarracenia purpurea var. burkii]
MSRLSHSQGTQIEEREPTIIAGPSFNPIIVEANVLVRVSDGDSKIEVLVKRVGGGVEGDDDNIQGGARSKVRLADCCSSPSPNDGGGGHHHYVQYEHRQPICTETTKIKLHMGRFRSGGHWFDVIPYQY